MTRSATFRIVLATILTLLGASLVMPINLASAATAMTISAPNTSTVGHVRGTITTTASHVVIQPLQGGSPYSDPVVVATSGGVATYNLLTWGWEPAYPFTLAVRACASAQVESCEAEAKQSAAFTPTSVTPSMTWPGDTTLGPGESLALTVADPNGGGVLYGMWNGGFYDIARSGRTVIDLAADATDEFIVLRCDKVGGALCMETGESRTVTVNKSTSGSVLGYSTDHLKPDETPAEDLVSTVRFHDAVGTNFSVLWWLVDATTGVRLPGFGENVSGLEVDEANSALIGLDLTGVPEGTYRMVGTVSYTDAQVGRLSGPLEAHISFYVDRSAPTNATVQIPDTKIYPARDGFHDYVYVEVTDVGEQASLLLEVFDNTGALVSSESFSSWLAQSASWYGRTDRGVVVPPGIYRLRVTLTDAVGNSVVFPEHTVTAYAGQWVKKVFDQSLSVRRSLIDTWHGKCSTFAKAKGRHWSQGVGLYSNTKCNSKKWERSGIVLVNGFRLPKARSYSENVTIRAYGGASKLEKRSLAYLQPWSPAKSKWLLSTQLKPKVRAQRGYMTPIKRVKDSDGWIVWRTLAAYGSKYDVKEFRVTFSYVVFE